VAILAGSRGMSGAAVLAALGALRGGAGLVRVCTPASAQPLVAAGDPCLMTVALPEDEAGRVSGRATAALRESLSWASVVAIGPGLGVSEDVRSVVAEVWKSYAGPLVADADALNALAQCDAALWQARAGRATTVTPHPGEMARLRRAVGLAQRDEQDDEARLRCAWEFACRAGVTAVLKGHHTVVAESGRTYRNASGNPGMATGGMGDVLTGLIAALLGQGFDAFDAARLAVFAHGVAADRLAKRIAPFGYLSREVAEEIPAALHDAARPPIGFAR
jgi:NAD(P)H-hydrate epimerase